MTAVAGGAGLARRARVLSLVRERSLRSWRVAALAAAAMLASAGVSVGCSSTSVDPQAEAARWEYQEQLLLATQAVNSTDLEQARVHVEKARARAFNFEQQRKVDSLERLIAGAEALREGDAARARAEWAQIEDPALNREVRRKANQIGIEVPTSPPEIAGKERGE